MLEARTLTDSAVFNRKVLRLLCLVVLLLSLLTSLMSGVYQYDLSDLVQVAFTESDASKYIVFWELRLPRTLIAAVGGAALSIAGYLTQNIVRNPLASPNLTGVMSGASLSVLTSFVVGLPLPSLFWGVLGGLAGGIITLSISWNHGITPVRLILAGISVSAFCQAMVTFILLSDGMDSESLFFWLTGSNAGAQWSVFWPLVLITIPLLAFLIITRQQQAYLLLDDTVAHGLGIHLNKHRVVFGLTSVMLTAAAVGAFGPVGFIGLVSPHIARMLKLGIYDSAVIGATLLLLSDLLARTLLMPLEIPIGVLTALCGAPWFLYLILKRL
ncbi:FecCD family ABC transporter permease [Vibrio sp. HN007]|uniref:FecCD family ABC transporter permease n=1 Tax=Vibrio iocasae TaxID=3098914 RepID=UPI0035D4EE8C